MPTRPRPFATLGQNLLKARERKGWTQEEAAEHCGLSLKYWQRLEMGERAPAFITLCGIRGALEISWDELCRGC